jgi:hypothetical protein
MAGRLFVSRLDEARSPAASEKIPEIGRRPRARTEEIYDLPAYLAAEDSDAKDEGLESITRNLSGIQSKPEYKDNSEILAKLAEYLFDLFDANLMEDYAKMEKFEIRALESFQDYEQTEFTHEQHALHNEFVALFEQLIEGFLQSEGYSIDVFYNELVHFINKSKSSTKGKAATAAAAAAAGMTPAEEVLEVVSNYMQFDLWADLMRQQARRQSEFATMKEKLQQLQESAVSAGLFKPAGGKSTEGAGAADSKESHK